MSQHITNMNLVLKLIGQRLRDHHSEFDTVMKEATANLSSYVGNVDAKQCHHQATRKLKESTIVLKKLSSRSKELLGEYVQLMLQNSHPPADYYSEFSSQSYSTSDQHCRVAKLLATAEMKADILVARIEAELLFSEKTEEENTPVTAVLSEIEKEDSRAAALPSGTISTPSIKQSEEYNTVIKKLQELTYTVNFLLMQQMKISGWHKGSLQQLNKDQLASLWTMSGYPEELKPVLNRLLNIEF